MKEASVSPNYKCRWSNTNLRLTPIRSNIRDALSPGLRRKSLRPGNRWHLDEVVLKINGCLHYLWRAVDQDGDVLDILVQSRRDKKAAQKFFRSSQTSWRVIVRQGRHAPKCRTLPA